MLTLQLNFKNPEMHEEAYTFLRTGQKYATWREENGAPILVDVLVWIRWQTPFIEPKSILEREISRPHYEHGCANNGPGATRELHHAMSAGNGERTRAPKDSHTQSARLPRVHPR